MRAQTIGIISAFCLVQASMGASLFNLVQIEAPGAAESYVTGMNESDEVVGYFKDSEGKSQKSQAFHWKNGVTTTFQGFEGEAEALALNNHGQIVGRAKRNGVWTAWLRENGADIDLDEGAGESSAVSINDQGFIIGNIMEPGNVDNGFLLRPGKVMLTCCTGGPNGPSPWRVRAINNNGMVLGENFLTRDIQQPSDRIFLYPRTDETIALYTFGRGFALNSEEWIAGEFRYGISSFQAGIWRDENWMPLGAPISVPSRALDINDRGEAVGYAGERGMFWKNVTGAEIDTLVSLPVGVKISAGVAINNKSVVAVNLMTSDGPRAGVLEPLSQTLALPQVSLATPENGAVQDSNRLEARIGMVTPGATVEAVRFVLDRRGRRDPSGSPGLSWIPTSYESAGFATNEITAGPFSAVFDNLPPAQYVLGARIVIDGVALHVPPTFLAITGEATFRPYRVTFADEFEYGMTAAPGSLYDIEGSKDLLNWFTLIAGTEGGVFAHRFGETNVLFLRARKIATGTNFFGRLAPEPALAPQTLFNGEARFWSLDNQAQYNLQIHDGTFSGSTPERGVEGTYTYTAEGSIGRFRAVDPGDPLWIFDAEIQFPIVAGGFWPPYFRAEVRSGSQRKTLIGRFSSTIRF